METTTTNTDLRIKALASHLDVDAEDISIGSKDHAFQYDGEYLVLTDDEADQKAADYIRESVWAFNSDFIASHCPDGIDEDHITTMWVDRGEDCNDATIALIEAGNGMEGFIDDAIGADGRGHFLNTYDGEEYDEGDFFIYRDD